MVGGAQLGGVTGKTWEEIKLVYKKEKEGEFEMAAVILWLVHHKDPKEPIRLCQEGKGTQEGKGLPDEVALFKVLKQSGEFRGGCGAEGTRGDINEETNVLVGGGERAGGAPTHLKGLCTKHPTVSHNVMVEVRWVHRDWDMNIVCRREMGGGDEGRRWR